MPTFKQRLAYLENAKLALVAYIKKQKLERAHCSNTKQFGINDNKLNTNNFGNTSNIIVNIDTNNNKEKT